MGAVPGQWPPRKGRPAALVASPFPAEPREGGSGKAAQGDVLYFAGVNCT